MNFDALLPELEKHYSRDELLKGWARYAIRFFLANEGKRWQDFDAGPSLKLATKKNPNKTELVQLGFSVLRSREVYEAFLTSLPAFVPPLLEKLLWEDSLDRRQVEAIVGGSMVAPTMKAWQPVEVRHEFSFFKTVIHNAYSFTLRAENAEITTFLPHPLKQLMISCYPPPEGFTFLPIPSPGGAGITCFSAEETIFRELPALLAYQRQGLIKYSEKGKPNANGLRKLLRAVQIKEFYDADSDFPAIRSLLLAGLIYGYHPVGQMASAPELLRFLFGKHLEHNLAPLYLLSQLKGLGYLHPLSYNPDLMATLRNLFGALPEGAWISSGNLKRYARTHFLDLMPANPRDMYDKVYYEAPVQGHSFTHKLYLTTASTPALLHYPVLLGGAFLFAAFGLLELCYGPPPEGRFGTDWHSEYDSLQAVRLTALGAYVLGQRDAYETSQQHAAVRLVPDTDSLTIRAEGNKDLAEVILSSYARKVSDTRYQLAPGLFLKDCKTKKDVGAKITLFRQAIGAALPPFWEDYLRRMVESPGLIRPQPHLRVYRLPPDDRELHRLLVQDEVLKLLVTKAERFHILVDTKDEAAFRARLKELGILLE